LAKDIYKESDPKSN